jgi:hypothetical protein
MTEGSPSSTSRRTAPYPTDGKIVEKCESLDTTGYVVGGIAGILEFPWVAGAAAVGEGGCNIVKKFHTMTSRGPSTGRRSATGFTGRP